MKNLKIIVALLSAMLISSASVAGEISVTGNAKATMNVAGSDSTSAKQETGKTLSIENELVFGATGELDNGTTWKYSMQLDQGNVDDPTITFTSGWGTVGLFQAAGGLNAKHFGAANAVAYGSQYGRGNGATDFIDPYDIGGQSNIQYHTPAGLIPFGTVIKVAKGFAGAATNKPGDAPLTADTGDAMNYSIDIAPIDGLAIQASYFEADNASGAGDKHQKKEAGAIGAKYAFGNFTVGYTKGYVAPATSTTITGTDSNEYINNSYSVGMKVNDSLSLSYGEERSEENLITDGTDDTVKIKTIQGAYTMGGLTAAVALKDVENLGYVAGVDTKEATLFVTLAF